MGALWEDMDQVEQLGCPDVLIEPLFVRKIGYQCPYFQSGLAGRVGHVQLGHHIFYDGQGRMCPQAASLPLQKVKKRWLIMSVEPGGISLVLE